MPILPRSRSFRALVSLALALAALAAAPSAAQQTLVDESGSYSFTGQSMWDSGDAFRFDYEQFIGIDTNPGHVVIGAGTGDRVSVAGHSINPYFQFDSDFRLGVELGASLDSGSVDGNLDYSYSLAAPEQIRVGEAFSLSGAATPLSSSGFTTRAPTAEAYVDGILDAYVGGYARIEFGRPIVSDQDLRWGNRGFTNGDTRNRPYATLVDLNERQEIISVNRNQSGTIRYLGGDDLSDGDLLYDELGAGSSVSFGALELTAGNIDVVANGALVGGQVVGMGQDTLASAVLDIDHLLLGTPLLGQSLSHDWGAIDYSLGYDVVDLDAGLDINLEQAFGLSGDVLIELVFSQAVLVDGVLTDTFLGAIDEIPLITMLDGQVDVDARVLVEAMLSNDTRLGFVGSLDTTLMHAFAEIGWNILGNSGRRGVEVGPLYDNSLPIGLGDISVYENAFSIGQAEIGSFSFSLVPEPGTGLLIVAGCLGLAAFGRPRRARC